MQLFNYLKKIGVPNKAIEPNGEVSLLFLKNHIVTLWEAIEYVHAQPYKRTTNRDNYLHVLHEKRGTCSVKHALIAALAENSLPH